MRSIVVVGSQWGDEGKGKVTNYYSAKADIVVRYQGGNNAGHTVKFDGQEYHLQTIPSGIFNEKTLNILGNGMVINPISLYSEMKTLLDAGFKLNNMVISSRANVDLNYHLELDGLKEAHLKDKKIGTTKKGIGPCYTDKISRDGIRFADFIDEDFPKVYALHLKEKNEEIARYGGTPIDLEKSLKEYEKLSEFFKPYVKETVSILAKAKKANKKILFEGAQGTMLDIDFGTYPYVSSSNSSAGGAITGSGIGIGYIEGVVGIVKAYTTRVGEGPFVTELFNDLADNIREKAHEYGVVTHRPRRIGYLDLNQLRYSRNVNGFNYFALMLLDILSGIDEIKVCTHYELDGKIIDYVPASLKETYRSKPVYVTLPGWKEDISSVRKFEDLPINAQNYVKFIEKEIDAHACLISVGPDHNETIIKEDIF